MLLVVVAKNCSLVITWGIIRLLRPKAIRKSLRLKKHLDALEFQ